MKIYRAGVLALCLALGTISSPSSNAAVNYILDDGSLNTSVGVGGSGGDLLILNQFDADPDGSTITNVQINWTSISNNSAASVLIYDDPNDDGNLADLILLQRVDVTTANGGGSNNSYADYLFPDTSVTGQFYVGAYVEDMAGNAYPFGYDSTDPDYPGRSYFFERTGAGDLDLANPSGTSTLSGNPENFITPGNFMVRATGVTPVPIPEPTTPLLLALSTLTFGNRRRRNR